MQRTDRALVGDVQSVVQPVDGQSETCTAGSASRLVDDLGAGGGGLGDGRSASPSSCGADRGRSVLAGDVETDPVDLVT